MALLLLKLLFDLVRLLDRDLELNFLPFLVVGDIDLDLGLSRVEGNGGVFLESE